MRLLASCAVTALLCLCATEQAAAAQDDPMDWLIESNPGGAWRNYGDSVLMRRHDFGPGAHPVSGDSAEPNGYAASDNVYCGDGVACNTWQFSGNGTFNAAAGDGGQIIIVDGGGSGNVYFWSTWDGSYNGPQYIVGPMCGAAGWKLFDNSVMNGPTTWKTEIDQLTISRKSPNDCQPLAPSFTAWMRGSSELPYQSQGNYAGSLYLDAIVTEHYDHESPETSINKEVNVFVKNIGLVYWMAYSRTSPPLADLSARCPQISITGADSNTWASNQDAIGWHLTDCRYYMNYVPVPDGWSLSQYRWPYNQ